MIPFAIFSFFPFLFYSFLSFLTYTDNLLIRRQILPLFILNSTKNISKQKASKFKFCYILTSHSKLKSLSLYFFYFLLLQISSHKYFIYKCFLYKYFLADKTLSLAQILSHLLVYTSLTRAHSQNCLLKKLV